MASPVRERGVLLVDGVCVLCHGLVKVLCKLDRQHRLKFSTLQGDTAQRLLRGTAFESERKQLTSVIYVRGMDSAELQVFDRSTAALMALRDLGGGGRILSWLRVIPRVIRDGVYDWIARHRYGWFGRHDAVCPLPSQDDSLRFLP